MLGSPEHGICIDLMYPYLEKDLYSAPPSNCILNRTQVIREGNIVEHQCVRLSRKEALKYNCYIFLDSERCGLIEFIVLVVMTKLSVNFGGRRCDFVPEVVLKYFRPSYLTNSLLINLSSQNHLLSSPVYLSIERQTSENK